MNNYEYQKITLPVMTEEWKEDCKKWYRRSDELEDWIGILIEFMFDKGISEEAIYQALDHKQQQLFHLYGGRLEKEIWGYHSYVAHNVSKEFNRVKNEIVPQEKNYKALISSDVRTALRDELEISLRDLVEEYKNDTDEEEDEEEPLFPERTE